MFETAHAQGGGSREASFFVTEEFAFEQAFRDGGAIDGDEGACGARAVALDGAGHHFLAAAAFACDHDGGVRARDPSDHFEDRLHGRALTDHDIAEVDWCVREGFLLVAGGFAGFERALDDRSQVVGEGFLAEEVEGSEFHGLDDRIGGWECGGEDHHDLGVLLAEAFEEIDAVGGLEMEFCDDEVRFEGEEFPEPVFRIGSDFDPDLIGGEVALGPFEEVGFGIDDEDVLHPWSSERKGQGRKEREAVRLSSLC